MQLKYSLNLDMEELNSILINNPISSSYGHLRHITPFTLAADTAKTALHSKGVLNKLSSSKIKLKSNWRLIY